MTPSRFLPTFCCPALAGLVLALGAEAASAGAAWRYCLAVSEPERALYVSMPFKSSAPLSTLEKAYDSHLSRLGFRHEPATCPRADTEEAALLAREDAIAFNRTRGISPSVASWRYEN